MDILGRWHLVIPDAGPKRQNWYTIRPRIGPSLYPWQRWAQSYCTPEEYSTLVPSGPNPKTRMALFLNYGLIKATQSRCRWIRPQPHRATGLARPASLIKPLESARAERKKTPLLPKFYEHEQKRRVVRTNQLLSPSTKETRRASTIIISPSVHSPHVGSTTTLVTYRLTVR